MNERRDFFFGKNVCAICLQVGAKKIRYMKEIMDKDDMVIPGGEQHVHATCWKELREIQLTGG